MGFLDSFNRLTLALQSSDDPITIRGFRQMSRADAQDNLDDRTQGLQTVGGSLIKYHKLANTSFYQREHAIVIKKTADLSKNVRIPQLFDISGNVQDRKDNLLNFIITNVRQDLFRNVGQNMNETVLGFTSYEEFVSFQTNHINAMNEAQLKTLETVMNLLPFLENSKEERMRSFAITYDGNIALLQSGGTIQSVQAMPVLRA